MNKFIIILLGVLLLGTMAYMTSCATEGDSEYTTCDGSCSYDKPYSNQYSSSCYQSLSDCEIDSGHSCKDCS